MLALTTFDDDEDVFAALRAGAVGYLLKDVSGDRLVEALLAAARGESVLQPSVAARVVARFAELPDDAPPRPQPLVVPLSDRELEVLRLLAEGGEQPGDRRARCSSPRAPSRTTSPTCWPSSAPGTAPRRRSAAGRSASSEPGSCPGRDPGRDVRHLSAARAAADDLRHDHRDRSRPDRHTAASGGHRVRHFVRHYLEMVVAMLVGMFVLGPVEDLRPAGGDRPRRGRGHGDGDQHGDRHGRLDAVPRPLVAGHRRDVGRDVRAVPRPARAVLGRRASASTP